MRNLFSLDGGVMFFLTRLADIVILNLLFIVCCIPILTIGPALTALYTITLKMVKNEEAYIVKSYFKAFKDNFKISFFAWLILLAIGAFIGVDYKISLSLEGPLGNFFPYLFMTIFFLLLVLALYLFPFIARFENTLKNSFKNAILLALISLPYTVIIIIITAGIVALTLFVIPLQYSILIWFMCAFSGIAYFNSFFFRKAFKVAEPSEEAETDNNVVK